MTTTINASTSAGLVNTADTSGVLALQTAGTTAVSISASQVVTLTNALPVASGGTGVTSTTFVNLTTNVTGTLPVANGGTGVTTSTGSGANVLGTSPSISGAVLSSMASSVITSGTAVALSGTAVGFTGIPSWVNRITLMLYDGVSTNGTAIIQVQIGSGSYTTSGYTGAYGYFVNASSSGWATIATGFGVFNDNAPDARNGTMVLTRATGNTWVTSGMFITTNRGIMVNSTGYLALGGALDRIQITTVGGTNTFDAGSINILYE